LHTEGDGLDARQRCPLPTGPRTRPRRQARDRAGRSAEIVRQMTTNNPTYRMRHSHEVGVLIEPAMTWPSITHVHDVAALDPAHRHMTPFGDTRMTTWTDQAQRGLATAAK